MSQVAERTAAVQYTFADTFSAVKKAIESVSKFTLTRVSETTGTFDVTVKRSLAGNGELMTLSVVDHGSTCAIHIATSPKAPYALWRGVCEKDNMLFFDALDAALKTISKTKAPEMPTNSDSANSKPPIEDRLAKVKKLFDDGIISEEEYQQKRNELLAEI